MKVTHLEAYKQRTYQQRIDEKGRELSEVEAKYPEKKSKGRPKLLAADKLKDELEMEALEEVSNYD